MWICQIALFWLFFERLWKWKHFETVKWFRLFGPAWFQQKDRFRWSNLKVCWLSLYLSNYQKSSKNCLESEVETGSLVVSIRLWSLLRYTEQSLSFPTISSKIKLFNFLTLKEKNVCFKASQNFLTIVTDYINLNYFSDIALLEIFGYELIFSVLVQRHLPHSNHFCNWFLYS